MQLNIIKVQDTVTSQLQGIIRAISHQGRKVLLNRMAQEFVRQTKSNFGSSGQYRDGKWPRLSKDYAKKVGSSTPTLKRSGELYNSIRIGNSKENSITITTKNPYAAAHTFGYPPRNLPKRNFWPVQFQSPNYIRLLFNSEKDMNIVISKQLNILSSGALPVQTSTMTRMSPQYGNVFTAAN